MGACGNLLILERVELTPKNYSRNEYELLLTSTSEENKKILETADDPWMTERSCVQK